MAKGEEKHLIIGDFSSDEKTEYINLDFSQSPNSRMDRVLEDGIAYYYIDNIAVIPIRQEQ